MEVVVRRLWGDALPTVVLILLVKNNRAGCSKRVTTIKTFKYFVSISCNKGNHMCQFSYDVNQKRSEIHSPLRLSGGNAPDPTYRQYTPLKIYQRTEVCDCLLKYTWRKCNRHSLFCGETWTCIESCLSRFSPYFKTMGNGRLPFLLRFSERARLFWYILIEGGLCELLLRIWGTFHRINRTTHRKCAPCSVAVEHFDAPVYYYTCDSS